MRNVDRWAKYRDAAGRVDFDAMPEKLKQAFIREGERTPGRPLTPAERRAFEGWRKRAVGRPRIGAGFQRWNISLEKVFAKRVAAYAKSHGMTRSRVLAEGAKLLLANGED
jgi:hypothetical protein